MRTPISSSMFDILGSRGDIVLGVELGMCSRRCGRERPTLKRMLGQEVARRDERLGKIWEMEL
jgi:hypothetical protein